MKLYEVKPKSWIKIAGEKIFFDHLDGMYSYCLDEGGNVVHINASAEVEVIDKDTAYKEALAKRHGEMGKEIMQQVLMKHMGKEHDT